MTAGKELRRGMSAVCASGGCFVSRDEDTLCGSGLRALALGGVIGDAPRVSRIWPLLFESRKSQEVVVSPVLSIRGGSTCPDVGSPSAQLPPPVPQPPASVVLLVLMLLLPQP